MFIITVRLKYILYHVLSVVHGMETERIYKKRVGVTFTKSYLECMEYLVDKGIYVDYQDAIRDALRILFRLYDLETFNFHGEPDIVLRVRKDPEPSKSGD